MYQRTITKATLAAFTGTCRRRSAALPPSPNTSGRCRTCPAPGTGAAGGEGNRPGLEGRPGPAHAAATVNGKLAALNAFFSPSWAGGVPGETLRRQRELFRDPGRELHKGDYLRLLAAAKGAGNWRLYYLMETLASTGIRVSELKFVTVQAPARGTGLGGRKGRATGPPHPQTVPGAGQVLLNSGGLLRAGVRHPDGAAHGPVQHLEGVTPSL